MKRKAKVIISVGIVLVFILISWIIYTTNNISYQMNKLKGGTPNQKARAGRILTKTKNYKAIPVMIENLNDIRVSDINGKAPDYISCYMSIDLEELTDKYFGSYLCAGSIEENGVEWKNVINKWQNWYRNEYPQWLREHQQN